MILALLLGLTASSDAVDLLADAQDAFRQGEWARADRTFARAIDASGRTDDRSAALEARLGRVDLRLLSREPDSAAAIFPTSPGSGLSAEDSTLWTACKARLLQARGSDSALPVADSALSLARRSGNRALRGFALLVHSRIHLAHGQSGPAARDLQDVRAGDSPVLPSRMALVRAQLDLSAARPAPARKSAVEAWELARARGDVPAILEILPVRARSEELCGEPVAARASWTALRTLAEATGLPRQLAQAREEIDRLDRANAARTPRN